MKYIKFVLVLIVLNITAIPAEESNDKKKTNEERGYIIEQPGTITFTTGIKIKGKVEKPQVIIFLTKEKPIYQGISFTYSFKKEMQKPLLYKPVIPEMSEKTGK